MFLAIAFPRGFVSSALSTSGSNFVSTMDLMSVGSLCDGFVPAEGKRRKKKGGRERQWVRYVRTSKSKAKRKTQRSNDDVIGLTGDFVAPGRFLGLDD